MPHAQSIQTCHWARPTLFLPWPLWFDAADFEWSCTRGARPRPVPEPSTCETCEGWTKAGCGKPCTCDPDNHLGCTAP